MIEKLKFNSLKKKIILFVLTVIIISTIISTLIVSKVVNHQIRREEEIDKKAAVKSLSFSLIPMLDLYDYRQVEKLITSYLTYGNIVVISVFNDKGSLIRSVIKQNVSKKDLDIKKCNITENGKLIGSLEIVFSEKYIRERIKTTTGALIWGLTVFSLLLGFALYGFINYYFIVPLGAITETVKKINPDNLSTRLEIHRSDEIGKLAENFNQMTDNLKADITKRKKVEGELKVSEEKYRAIVENSHNGILIVDDSYRFVYVNDELCRILGYSREEIIGHDFREFLDEDSKKLVVNRYIRRQRGEDVPRRYEFNIVRKDGEEGCVEISSTVVKDSVGQVKTISQILDLTERKKLEEQLLQAQKMEAIGRMTGSIAHEFNNMLMAISGYSELLSKEVGKQKPLNELVKKIIEVTKRSSKLTHQLLAFSHKQMLQLKTLNLNRLLKKAEEILPHIIREDIKLRTNLEPKIAFVKADPGQIEQVIMNLVINASDAMPEGGTITIATKNETINEDYSKTVVEATPGKYVSLSVKDTGTGMAQVTIKHIFEPFFSTKKKNKGTGLGLSTVYGIIKQHKGWIDVQSQPGQGSTFKIYLPATETPAPEESERANLSKSLQNHQGKGERILLVEDQEEVLELFKRALSENGYTVFAAKKAKDARKIFRSEEGRFDLLLCDVVLPDESGFILADQLSSLSPNISIILTSGYIDDKIELKKIERRGFQFLQKPYRLSKLLRAIRNAIIQK